MSNKNSFEEGGQTIKDAIDALRSDDAANSSMPTDGTDDAGAQA